VQGVEKFFRKEFGSALTSTEVGYAGGEKASPTYGQVCDGNTGHAEGTTTSSFCCPAG
jgi:peptide methionine sulfoxide reductase MsrA